MREYCLALNSNLSIVFCYNNRCQHLVNVGNYIKNQLPVLISLYSGDEPIIDLDEIINTIDAEEIEKLKKRIQINQRLTGENLHLPGSFISIRNDLLTIKNGLLDTNPVHKQQQILIGNIIMDINCHIDNITNNPNFSSMGKINEECGDKLAILE